MRERLKDSQEGGKVEEVKQNYKNKYRFSKKEC